ncbi:MAG TPA: hypothetical protein VGG81_05495 [Edaphobacter sp.]|jgi:hypothetical protein
MPLCSTYQLRRTGLKLGTALLIILGAPLSLHAQQLDTSNSSSSSNESANLNPPAASLADASFSPRELPDSPGYFLQSQTPQTTPTPAVVQTTNPDAVSPNGNQQTKRVLGIVPNFRSVSADVKLPPMSPKDKFIVAGKDTFDYSALFVAGIQAGFAMNSKSYPEFGQGLKGYGQYYWHTLADTASENFFVGGIGPVVFKQDNRFYTLGHGSFGKRSFYAVTRVLVTRKDDGDSTFNFSEVIGSGASAGFSTLWYPKQYQTWTKVGQKWLTSDLIDCFNFWWKEWWPTANKYVFHTK